MIELTVGLPMYRSKEIAWLALESLCRQKDIDFKWELLIIEEEKDCFGQERIKEYAPRLKDVGCVRLKYVSLKEWVPLSRKWKYMADLSSKKSICFLLQAADCYAQPFRLKETYDIFKKDENIDWSQAPQGAFYNILEEEYAIFDYKLYSKSRSSTQYQHPCALNMSIKTSLIKKISTSDVERSVDGFIFNDLTEKKGDILKVGWNHSNNWKLGLDSDGLNNISRKRTLLIKERIPPFRAAAQEEIIENYIPLDIMIRLRECKETAENFKLTKV